MKKIFIDANVLFYKIISDLLFDASVLGVFEVYWSEDVINEYLEHGPQVMQMTARHKGVSISTDECKKRIIRKIELFKIHSGFKIVDNYSDIQINENRIKDRDDIHVFKAAKKADCQIILTSDRGFRNVKTILDMDIVSKKADQLFCEVFDSDEEIFMDILKTTIAGIERQKKINLKKIDIVNLLKTGKLKKLAQKI